MRKIGAAGEFKGDSAVLQKAKKLKFRAKNR